MNGRAALLGGLLAAGLACGGAAPPAPESPSDPVAWSARAAVDKTEVQVGEDLTFTLTIEHPAGGEYLTPPASAFAPFDVIGVTENKVSQTETRLEYRLAAYRLPAELEIPAIELRHRDDAGDPKTLRTAAIPVRVVTSLTPEVEDIHDIKEPVDLEVPRDLSLFFWLLGALLAAAVLYLIYRKLRKEPAAVPAWVPPPTPPDEEAEAALLRLAEKKLIERGEIPSFYTELSEIVKRYAGRRFDVPYLERTTSEVLGDLRPLAGRELSPEVLSDLRAILEASDLVKFAKRMPERSQAEGSLALAFELLQRTRRAAAATPETLEPARTA
jgi:hypothetical protein